MPLRTSFVDRGPQQRFSGFLDMFNTALQGLFIARFRGGFAFHDEPPCDNLIIGPPAPMQLMCVKQAAFCAWATLVATGNLLIIIKFSWRVSVRRLSMRRLRRPHRIQ
jgi:hypothetical protein